MKYPYMSVLKNFIDYIPISTRQIYKLFKHQNYINMLKIRISRQK